MVKKILWITNIAIAVFIGVFITLTQPVHFQNKPTHHTSTPVPTPTQPSANTDYLQIFDPSQISAIHLDIPNSSKKVLANATLSKYVPATFQIKVGEFQSPVMDVQIKVKGTTSRYGINTTYAYTSFKVKFNYDKQHKTQTLLGLKSLTLNAMTQDSSKLHETFAYETYRAMGLVASHTGYTHLTLSKNIARPNRGLYLVLESVDDVFLGANFQDVTQHLYENARNFTDISPASVGGNSKVNGSFKVKQGWKATPNRDDLRAFAKGIQANGKKLWNFLATNSDRERLIMLFAVDNFTGGWDTYSGPLQNNFQIRSDLNGKMTFIPWGLDNTWGENYFNDVKSTHWMKSYNVPIALHDDFFFALDKPTASFPGAFLIGYHAGVKDVNALTNYQLRRGALFRKCLVYSPCATLYYQDLKRISDWAANAKLTSQMQQTEKVIKHYTSDYAKAEQKRVEAWVTKQQANVGKVLAKHCNKKVTKCN